MIPAKLVTAYHIAVQAWEASHGFFKVYWGWRCRRLAERLHRAGQGGKAEAGDGDGGSNDGGCS